MKKFLFSLIALMLFVAVAGAQNSVKSITKQAPFGVLQANGNAILPVTPGFNKLKAAKTPAKIQLADNQKIMGPYTTDDLGARGLGLNNVTGNVPIAALLDVADLRKFNGGKVVALRFGLVGATTVNNVFIKAFKNNEFVDLYEQEFTGSAVVGWNTVTLSTPYTLDFTGIDYLLLGFEYVQSSGKYPLSFAGEETRTAAYANFGEGVDWYMLDGAGGSLSVQAIVENEYPESDVVINGVLTPDYLKSGEDIEYMFSYYNDGTKPVSVYSFGVAVDGKEVAVIDAPTAELSVEAKEYKSVLKGLNLATGNHTLSVYVKQMNNETPAKTDTASYEFGVYTETLPRQKYLVEHFTSQGCTYCPLGIKLLTRLSEMRGDLAWVSIHGDMNVRDIYTIDEGNTINGWLCGGLYPSAAFNRVPLGDNSIATSIGVYEQYIETVAKDFSTMLDQIASFYPSFASVDIDAKINETTGKLDIKVSGNTTSEFASLYGDNAALTVYVTEDSLVARQLDNGTWKSKFVHDNVLRSVVSSVYGDKVTVTGNKYENNYSIDVPADWNKANLCVTASIGRAVTEENFNNEKLWISNANKVKVNNTTTGITAPSASAENRPVEYYTLDGIRTETPVKGLNIVKLANGEVRKVMIK
ncbi:MAG: Omp28-related outer membrane protein [Prevotella sp.]|nr:Omp28-related outer membrane protein [Prevotella sp.]